LKEIERQKTTNYRVYIAEDGKEFESSSACVDYEKALRGLQQVYCVMESPRDVRSSDTLVCIMSKEEDAKKWIEYKIEEMSNKWNQDYSRRFYVRGYFVDEYLGEHLGEHLK